MAKKDKGLEVNHHVHTEVTDEEMLERAYHTATSLKFLSSKRTDVAYEAKFSAVLIEYIEMLKRKLSGIYLNNMNRAEIMENE